MKLVQGNKEVAINTISNWPLIEDLFIKWGYSPTEIDAAKTSEYKMSTGHIDNICSELSAWGIPWKRVNWE